MDLKQKISGLLSWVLVALNMERYWALLYTTANIRNTQDWVISLLVGDRLDTVGKNLLRIVS